MVSDGRMAREALTVAAMIDVYCRANHPSQAADSGHALCPDCAALRDYALARLSRCPFRERKPTCRSCRVHCYRSDMRDRIKEVMRFSGPRMLLRYPVLSIRHLVDQLL